MTIQTAYEVPCLIPTPSLQPNQHVADILGSEIAVVTEVAKYLQLIQMLVMNLENINKVAAKNLSIDEVVAMKDTIHLLVHDLTIIKGVYSNLGDIKRAAEYGAVISEMQSFMPILKETVDRALEVDANLRQTQALYIQMVELAETARLRYDQLATTNNNVGSTMTLALEPAGSTRFFMTLNQPTNAGVILRPHPVFLPYLRRIGLDKPSIPGRQFLGFALFNPLDTLGQIL